MTRGTTAGRLLAAIVIAALLPAGDAAAHRGGCDGATPERILTADPSNYRAILPTLQPGDHLRLDPGTYAQGLPLSGVSGEPGRCIVIEGPATGPPAVFTGRDCCNTLSLQNVSYLVIRRLELDGQGRLGDGVKAEGTADWVHHLTLEDLRIRGHGADQQIVGINAKCPAWSWVVRRNVIERAGTGMYFGNSDGEDPFVDGLVEHNLIVDTIGYNLQVKHQNGRETALGQPADATTVIRHNVFSKAQNGSTGAAARPNLLVGHWPLAGAGSDDDYLIYGNFFYQNPTEALFQGEGNVIFHNNLLVNDFGPAVHVQPHNDLPRRVRLFWNTVVASTTGLRVSGGDPGFLQRVAGNAVFAGTPIAGGTASQNLTDSYAAAAAYLQNPDGVLTGAVDRLDLFPLPGAVTGSALVPGDLASYPDWDRDWNGAPRHGPFRGAYAGDGSNPGWRLALARKPASEPAIFTDGFESGDLAAWTAAP